jgi:uncharacterized membrane protein
MFKEAVKEKDTMDGNPLHEESLHKGYRYGYIYLVSLESIENSSALAALTFVDITGALAGALISIALFVVLAIKTKSIMGKLPVKKLRIISGVLLAITATPLIIYSTGLPSPEWMHWIIPPLGE